METAYLRKTKNGDFVPRLIDGAAKTKYEESCLRYNGNRTAKNHQKMVAAYSKATRETLDLLKTQEHINSLGE